MIKQKILYFMLGFLGTAVAILLWYFSLAFVPCDRLQVLTYKDLPTRCIKELFK